MAPGAAHLCSRLLHRLQVKRLVDARVGQAAQFRQRELQRTRHMRVRSREWSRGSGRWRGERWGGQKVRTIDNTARSVMSLDVCMGCATVTRQRDKATSGNTHARHTAAEARRWNPCARCILSSAHVCHFDDLRVGDVPRHRVGRVGCAQEGRQEDKEGEKDVVKAGHSSVANTSA